MVSCFMCRENSSFVIRDDEKSRNYSINVRLFLVVFALPMYDEGMYDDQPSAASAANETSTPQGATHDGTERVCLNQPLCTESA